MSGHVLQGIDAASSGPKPASMMQHPPKPLIAPTGSPGLNCVVGAVNQLAAPFQALPSGEGGAAGVVANGIGGVLGVVGAPQQILDSAFAALTAPIAKIFPALPAVTLLGMHVGPPHGHLHPPSFTPPATPSPIPLPSLGVLLGAGSLGVLVGGLPAARAGDIGIAVACGSFCPPFEVHTGSSNVFIGGSRAARMGDITRHCNPVNMAGLGLAMAIAGVVAGAAGAIAFGSATAAAQAAADAAVLALKMLVGRDLAVPPAYGTLIGPPAGNVMIGGFPCPPLMESLMGLLKKLKKPPKSKGNASEGDNAPCGKAGHPVNVVTGASFNSYVEFVSGGLFQWKRHYSSDRAGVDSPVGYGSRHTYQHSLRLRLHTAVLTNWDGEQIVFPRFERGSNVTRAKGYVLTRVDSRTYRVRYREQPELEFSGDRWAGDLNLVRVRKDRKELLITRDAAGRISAFTETDFSAQTQRRFELISDRNGHVQQLVEMPTGFFASQPIAWRAYAYSDAGDLIASAAPNSYPDRFEYDAKHRLTKEQTPLGYAFTYEYDEQGRVVASAGQDGLWGVKLAYPKDGLTTSTYLDGSSYEIHYDKEGAVTKVIASDGHTLTRVMDVEGRVEVEIDGAGRQMRWLYDGNGAHYARLDDFGHLLPTALEAPYTPNPFYVEPPRTHLEWLLGDFAPRRSSRADGGLWPISWNGPLPAALGGLPLGVANISRNLFALREGPRQPAPAPRVEIDTLGRKIVETDARGATRRWWYDVAGNLIAEQDRDGAVRRFTIASWNLRGEVTDGAGQSVRYQYSSLAKVTGVVDPFGLETRYDYDLRERLVRIHRHGGVREEYVYDVNSHFIEKRDGDGQVLFTNEPHDNHLVGKRTLTSGGYHQFDYDEAGRVIEASTQDHEIKLTYEPPESYDPRSPDYPRRAWPETDFRDGKGVKHVRRKAAVETSVFERFKTLREQGEARLVVRDATGQETTLVYDQGVVRRFCPSGTIEMLQFDPEGRLLARLVYRGPFRAPRLGSGTAPAEPPPRVSGAPRDGVWGTRYHYTLEGDLVRIDDTARGTTVFEVDGAHRLAAEVTPRGERLEYIQDVAGNVVAKPGLAELRVLRGNFLASSRDERFEFNTRHHLAQRERHDGSQVRYQYDSFDMLVAVEHQSPTGKNQRWEASYDALGRRIRATQGGKTREFFWDYERLAAEIQPDGTLRLYQYASRTALIPIGFTEYESIDAPPEAGKSYVVFSSPIGMPLCVEDQEGNIVWWAQRVDPYGAIEVAEGSSLEYNLRWPGHYFDPETGLHYNRWRYYDPILGRYLQSDPLGYGGSPVNLYAYASNPLVQVDLFGLECEGDKDGGAPKSNENDGKEKAPSSEELKAMSKEDQQEYCKKRAQELNEQLREQDAATNKKRRDAYDADPRPVSEKGPPPEDTHFAENGTTICVGVVKDEDGNHTTVVTSSKDRGPSPVELKEGEQYRPTGSNAKERAQDPASQPELAAGGVKTGERVPVTDKDGNPKLNSKGEPITKPEREGGSRQIIRDENGNIVEEKPYDKASTSDLRNNPDAEGSTDHHAEQRMVNGTRPGEEVTAMAPSKECCPGCHQAMKDSGNLDKIPPDLQGQPPPTK